MAGLDSLPSIVREAHFLTEFLDDGVIVHQDDQRNMKQEERWLRDAERLGGGYGAVWREQEVDRHGMPKQGRVRAVKVFELFPHDKLSTVNIGELEAMLSLLDGRAAARFVRIDG
jgi:hypothetical protein